MRKLLFGLAGLLSAGLTLAEPFIELGIGVQDGCLRDYDEKQKRMECSGNPLGLLGMGYTFGETGLTLLAEHRSSLVEKDKGMNSLFLKYKWEW